MRYFAAWLLLACVSLGADRTVLAPSTGFPGAVALNSSYFSGDCTLSVELIRTTSGGISLEAGAFRVVLNAGAAATVFRRSVEAGGDLSQTSWNVYSAPVGTWIDGESAWRRITLVVTRSGSTGRLVVYSGSVRLGEGYYGGDLPAGGLGAVALNGRCQLGSIAVWTGAMTSQQVSAHHATPGTENGLQRVALFSCDVLTGSSLRNLVLPRGDVSGMVSGWQTVNATGAPDLHPYRVQDVAGVVPGFTLAINPASVSLGAGASASAAVTAGLSGGWTAPITVSGSTTGAGLSASLNSGVLVPGGELSLLTTTNHTTPGQGTVTLQGSASGYSSATASAQQAVEQAGAFGTFQAQGAGTLTVANTGSVQYGVTLSATSWTGPAADVSVSGLPSGVTVSGGAGWAVPGAYNLTFTAAAVVPGDYTLNVQVTAGGLTRSLPVVLTVYAVPDFAVSAQSLLELQYGASAGVPVALDVTNWAGADVTFSAVSDPAGLQFIFNPTSLNADGQSVCTVSASGAAAGSYTATLTGTSSGVTRSAAVAVAVGGQPDFGFSVSSFDPVEVSGQTFADLTVSTANWPGESVLWSAVGLPSGWSFSVTGTRARVVVPPATSAGTRTFTIRGTALGLVREQSASVTVTPAAGSFTLSVLPEVLQVPAGGSAVFVVTVADPPDWGWPVDIDVDVPGAYVTLGDWEDGELLVEVRLPQDTPLGPRGAVITGNSGLRSNVVNRTVNAVPAGAGGNGCQGSATWEFTESGWQFVSAVGVNGGAGCCWNYDPLETCPIGIGDRRTIFFSATQGNCPDLDLSPCDGDGDGDGNGGANGWSWGGIDHCCTDASGWWANPMNNDIGCPCFTTLQDSKCWNEFACKLVDFDGDGLGWYSDPFEASINFAAEEYLQECYGLPNTPEGLATLRNEILDCAAGGDFDGDGQPNGADAWPCQMRHLTIGLSAPSRAMGENERAMCYYLINGAGGYSGCCNDSVSCLDIGPKLEELKAEFTEAGIVIEWPDDLEEEGGDPLAVVFEMPENPFITPFSGSVTFSLDCNALEAEEEDQPRTGGLMCTLLGYIRTFFKVYLIVRLFLLIAKDCGRI